MSMITRREALSLGGLALASGTLLFAASGCGCSRQDESSDAGAAGSSTPEGSEDASEADA